MKRILKSQIFAFILGAIIFGGCGTLAATIYATGVNYRPTNDNFKQTNGNNIVNVAEALDALYDRAYDFNNITTLFNTSNGTNISRTTSINVNKGTYLVLASFEQAGSSSSANSSLNETYTVPLTQTKGTCQKLDGRHIYSAATSQFISQYLWNNYWYTLYLCDFSDNDTISVKNLQTGTYTETMSSVSVNAIKIK